MIELDFPGEVRKSEELNNLNLSFYLKTILDFAFYADPLHCCSNRIKLLYNWLLLCIYGWNSLSAVVIWYWISNKHLFVQVNYHCLTLYCLAFLSSVFRRTTTAFFSNFTNYNDMFYNIPLVRHMCGCPKRMELPKTWYEIGE